MQDEIADAVDVCLASVDLDKDGKLRFEEFFLMIIMNFCMERPNFPDPPSDADQFDDFFVSCSVWLEGLSQDQYSFILTRFGRLLLQ